MLLDACWPASLRGRHGHVVDEPHQEIDVRHWPAVEAADVVVL